MTVRVHPFPSRTRQLSSLVPTILGWKRPGKIGRCQHKQEDTALRRVFFVCSGFYFFCRFLRTANLNTELNCGNMARPVPYSSRGLIPYGLYLLRATASGTGKIGDYRRFEFPIFRVVDFHPYNHLPRRCEAASSGLVMVLCRFFNFILGRRGRRPLQHYFKMVRSHGKRHR